MKCSLECNILGPGLSPWTCEEGAHEASGLHSLVSLPQNCGSCQGLEHGSCLPLFDALPPHPAMSYSHDFFLNRVSNGLHCAWVAPLPAPTSEKHHALFGWQKDINGRVPADLALLPVRRVIHASETPSSDPFCGAIQPACQIGLRIGHGAIKPAYRGILFCSLSQ